MKEALRLDDEPPHSYVANSRGGGIEELIKTQYAGKASQLDEVQTRQWCEELNHKVYMTTKAVPECVQESFAGQYILGSMRDLLHRSEYELKKPNLVPRNPDREAQEIFVEQNAAGCVPSLKERRIALGALVVSGLEGSVHLTSES